MSPDSASCSTRGGSGVCGGGSRSPFGAGTSKPGTAARLSVSASDSASGSTGAFFRRFLTSRSSSTGESYAGSPISGSMSSQAAAAGPDRLGGLALVRGVGGLAAEQAVAQLREPGGHLVDRRRGDHEDAEEGEQDQQRHDDVRRPHQVEQQAGHDEADGAAGGLERVGVAERGLRVAVGDVDDAEHAERERGPADDLAPGGTVVQRVAHVAPADEDQHQRQEPADLADRSGGDGPDDLHDAARELPPDGGRGDHGQAEHDQPDAVATVLGLEVAGGAPDAARGRPQTVGDRHPDGGDTVTQRAEGAEHRTGAVADGARSRPPAAGGCRAALGALAGTPGSGARATPSGRLGPAGTGPAAAGRGRALAPRPRRGRRTGRHGHESRPKSHQSLAPQVRVAAADPVVPRARRSRMENVRLDRRRAAATVLTMGSPLGLTAGLAITAAGCQEKGETMREQNSEKPSPSASTEAERHSVRADRQFRQGARRRHRRLRRR